MGRDKKKKDTGDGWASGLEQDLGADLDGEVDADGGTPELHPDPLGLADVPSLDSIEDALVRVGILERERDEAVAARQRALADLVNFQRRSVENERRAAERGTAEVIRSLVNVLDHVDLALDQDAEALTVESLLDGVRLVRQEFAKLLGSHGVERVAPEPGDEFDPTVHQAMLRQETTEVLPDHILAAHQAGYRMGPVILRPAMVVVGRAPDEDAPEPESAPADDADD